MKKFIRNLAIFFLVQLFIWASVLWVYLRHRPYGKEYIAASIDKHRLLEEQPSPRILLIGGSNVAFGFDSVEINRRLSYNPVNMGLYVGLGLDFMLEEVEPSLRTGDVVVVSLEYEFYDDQFYYGLEDGLFLTLEERPETIRFLNLRNGEVLLNRGFNGAGRILRSSVSYMTGSAGALIGLNAVYKRNAFNQYGDLVAHRNLPSTKFELGLFNSGDKRSTILRTINRLNRFSEACQQKGVKLFYLYPSVPQQYFKQNKELIDELAATIKQELHFQSINTPEEMSLPLSDFFDSEYHVSSSGIRKRTDQLIERLSERLNEPSTEQPVIAGESSRQRQPATAGGAD